MPFAQAVQIEEASIIPVIASCVQAVVRCCPLRAIREICAKLTPLLLGENAIALDGTAVCRDAADRPNLSRELTQAMVNRDGTRFASSFRHFFAATKRWLLEVGAAGAGAPPNFCG